MTVLPLRRDASGMKQQRQRPLLYGDEGNVQLFLNLLDL